MSSSAEELILKISGDSSGGKKAVDDIEAAVQKAVKALSGDGLSGAANAAAEAIKRLGGDLGVAGGITKLSSAEQERYNTLMGKAVEKSTAMGTAVPAAWKEIEAATRNAEVAAVNWQTKLSSMQSVGQTVGLGLSAALTAPLIGMGAAALKSSIDFESAFAGVKKTVAGTPEELNKINVAFREMAKATPASAVELAKIGEMAGQLGVQKEKIIGFTKTIVDISSATSLTADEAGSSFARLANVLKMPQDQFSNLGSAVVALGNFGASTEQEMLSMAQRIAAAGATANMTAPQILGISNALSSVGIEAEAGGTAVSRVINKIGTDVASGGGKLDVFAKIAGMSAKQFQRAWHDDAGVAFSQFMQGLAKARETGGDTLLGLMEELDFKEVRLRNAFMAAANAGDLMRDSIALGTKAFKENTEITRASEERYKTTANQLKVLWNNITDVSMTIGDALTPALNDGVVAIKPMVRLVGDLAKGFKDLPGPMQATALGVAGMVAAAGPLILVGSGVIGIVLKTSALLTAFPAIGGAATVAVEALTTGMLGMAAVATGVLALAGAVGTLSYGLTRLADVASGGKLSGWLTPFISGAADLNKTTQEVGAGQDAIALAFDRTGIRAKSAAEALQLNTVWVRDHIKSIADAAAAHNAFVGPMQQTIQGTQTMAEKVQALTAEQKADIISKYDQKESLKAIAKETGIALEVVTTFIRQQHASTVAGKAHAKAMEEYASAGENVRATVDALSGAVVEGIKFDLARKISQESIQTAYGVTANQIRAIIAVEKDDAAAAKVLLEIHNKVEAGVYGLDKAIGKADESELKFLHTQISVNDALKMVERSIPPVIAGFFGIGGSLENVGQKSTEIDDLKLKMKLASERSALFGSAITTLSTDLTQLAQVSGGTFGGIVQDIAKAVTAMKTARDSAESFKASLASGDKAGAAVSAVGMAGSMVSATGPNSDVGTVKGQVKGAASGALTGLSTGAAIGTMFMPGVGTAIGAAVGAIAGGLVGWARNLGASAAEKAGRTVEADFEKQFGGFDGMMKAVGQAYADTGHGATDAQAAVQALMAAEKQGGDATKAMVEKINAVFEQQKKLFNDNNAALGGLLKSGQDLGVKLPPALQGSIQKLIEMGKVTGDNASLFASLTGSTEVDFKKISDIAQRAGADLKDLGPKFEGAKLHDLAGGIINDFDTLQRGLDDTDEALRIMKKPINDLVNESIKFKTDIPENMRPWIEQLQRTGQLTDENGDKLTDLSGLKFGEPVKTEFQKILDKLSELIDKITNPLSNAINNIPAQAANAASGMHDSADRMVRDLGDVEDAVNAVNWGHSPGGLKEIPLLLQTAQNKFMSTAAIAGYSLGGIEANINDLMNATDGWGESLDDAQKKLIALNKAKQAGTVSLVGDSGGDGPGGSASGGDPMLSAAQLHDLAASAYKARFGSGPTDAQLMALATAANYVQGTSMSQSAAVAFLNSQGAMNAVKASMPMPVGYMAKGGVGTVTRPTLFLAGEAGNEDYAFSGGGKSFRGGGAVTVNVTVEGNVWTERDLADAIKDHINGDLRMVKQYNLRGQ